MSTVRPARRALLVAAVAALAGTLWTAPAHAASPPFGTAPVVHAPTSTTQTAVTAVTTGHFTGFDRIIYYLSGPIPGYRVQYQQTIVADPSGQSIGLPGLSHLLVRMRPTSTAHPAPQRTVTPLFPELLQIKGAGDFEGVTQWGVGLSAQTGMRVFTVASPNRLVIDLRIP